MRQKNDFQPFVPASTSLPEITLKAVLLGIALSIILGAANAYLGLFAGLTVSASVPAAVISMAVLVRMVAIVTPEIGLFEEPTNPAI